MHAVHAQRVPGLLLPLLLCVSAGVGAGPSEDALEENCARLERELPRLCELAEVPGVSIAVADRSGVRWRAAVGTRDRRSGAPVDVDTVFEAASLSKPVFAYAVLQLVDQGVLELDEPLVSYAPLPDVERDPRHRALTARMVLSHSTGLPNWRPGGGALEFGADPGVAWRYSGEGFVLLQRVVEELVADSLQNLATALVFEPLEMTRTSFVWQERFAANVAVPHDAEGEGRDNRRVTQGNAAFSLLTTASDYARFLAALLSGEGLEEETVRALIAPQVRVPSDGVAWGLGVGLEELGDERSLWHWGHNGGYRAYCVAYPERDLALVYFTSSDNGMRFLRRVVELGTGSREHPAIVHLDYESLDAPRDSDAE
jgi:CubicO group peptidase (beta-lactamase class C family)